MYEMDDRPWLKNYDQGVPHTLAPYPQRTLLDVVTEIAHECPYHTAMLFKGASLSYARLEELSDAFAAALSAQGVHKGDRVALVMPNCPQIIIAQLGVWKAGAVAAVMNPLYTKSELEQLLAECEAQTAVVLSRYYRKIKSIEPRTGLRRVIVTNVKEYLPTHLRVLYTALREWREGDRVHLEAGDTWMRIMLEQHDGSLRPGVTVDPGDPALILFTGGTTGVPKGTIATHHAILIAGMQLRAWLSALLADRDDIIVLAMPMFHVYGNVGVFATALVGGNTIAVVPNPRDLNDLMATIRSVRPVFLPGDPTLFAGLLDRPEVKASNADFRSIKLCISGSALLLPETRERFERLTGGRMVEGYALTESMMGAVVSPVNGKSKSGSVGLPLPDVEIRIVDADTGEGELPPGRVGEILMRAPQLMQGYVNRPYETAQTVRDGWLHTGDLGFVDGDGYLFVIDRKNDVIASGAFRVWPREVEEVIASHPAVEEVGVAGVPVGGGRGQAVKAWVALREGGKCTVEEMREYCHQRLADYKVPKYVEFRERLPKSPMGRVLRRELVDEEWPK
jgi:long-chain acyl-CoA synthetase